MDAVRLADESDQPGDQLPALPEWREFAACADEPTDVFFDESAEGSPRRGASVRAAW